MIYCRPYVYSHNKAPTSHKPYTSHKHRVGIPQGLQGSNYFYEDYGVSPVHISCKMRVLLQIFSSFPFTLTNVLRFEILLLFLVSTWEL